jgi:hypothetical protein
METNNSLKSRKPSIKYYQTSGFSKIVWRGSEINVSDCTVTVDADIQHMVEYTFWDNMESLSLILLSPKRRSFYLLQRWKTWRQGEFVPSYRWDIHGPFRHKTRGTSVSKQPTEEGDDA